MAKWHFGGWWILPSFYALLGDLGPRSQGNSSGVLSRAHSKSGCLLCWGHSSRLLSSSDQSWFPLSTRALSGSCFLLCTLPLQSFKTCVTSPCYSILCYNNCGGSCLPFLTLGGTAPHSHFYQITTASMTLAYAWWSFLWTQWFSKWSLPVPEQLTCDRESRIDAEKMGKKASLFFITNAFSFFHIVFCIRFMALKRIPGMFLQCWFILEACDKVSLSKYLIEVVSFYPCQE